MKLAALLFLLPLVASAPSENEEGLNWAVLVAGSSGWSNYRHQSDICHAYQIMKDNGIPDERIIVMMYDDIAGNSRNPHPGEIFNHPDMDSDVYAGVPKDYTGSAVTPANFLAVLKGDAEALAGIGSGKVVSSGPNDRIFVNLDDHGAPGYFAFPSGILTGDDLAQTVTEMNADGKYKEMMIYIEACESGSMFQDLYPVELNAYGLSASNPYESSWATYCGTSMGTCLGDEFSVNWMEDTEANDPATETLNEQFVNTNTLTLGSEVMQWGDIEIDAQVVATFFGATSNGKKRQTYNHAEADAIPSQDVPLVLLERELLAAKTDFERTTLAKEVEEMKERRAFVISTMKNIVKSAAGEEVVEAFMEKKNTKITDWKCYNAVVKSFSNLCFNLGQSTYAGTTIHALINLCEAGYPAESVISSMNSVCQFPTIYNAV